MAFRGRFQLEDCVRVTEHSKVYSCRGPGNLRLVHVAKILELESSPEKIEKYYRNEVGIRNYLGDHKNVLRLLGLDRKKHMLILEVCTGGCLLHDITRNDIYSSVDASIVMRQILAGLRHCHDRGIIHRNLGLSNVLLYGMPRYEAVAKICDFGFAKIVGTDAGKPGWEDAGLFSPPEMLGRGEFDKPGDLWACGVILFSMLTGCHPFLREYKEHRGSMVRKVLRSDFEFSANIPILLPESKDFISNILLLDPDQRMTVDEALEHLYITQRRRWMCETERRRSDGDVVEVIKVVITAIMKREKFEEIYQMIGGRKGDPIKLMDIEQDGTITYYGVRVVGYVPESRGSSSKDEVVCSTMLMLQAVLDYNVEMSQTLTSSDICCSGFSDYDTWVPSIEIDTLCSDHIDRLDPIFKTITIENISLNIFSRYSFIVYNKVIRASTRCQGNLIIRYQESRIWKRDLEREKYQIWKMVHLHRSPSTLALLPNNGEAVLI